MHLGNGHAEGKGYWLRPKHGLIQGCGLSGLAFALVAHGPLLNWQLQRGTLQHWTPPGHTRFRPT